MSMQQESLPPFGRNTLPAGIRSRMVPRVNGLAVHVLEAGHEEPGRPGVLLLHGFPELAYSWRKVLLPLAEAGYHVFAPDLRGFGRTTGWDASYDADQTPFRMLNVVRDAIGLVFALGHRRVAAVVGHDAGSYVAGWCALTRPDIFAAVAMMSAPFTGAPPIPFGTGAESAETFGTGLVSRQVDAQLAALSPPRKYYQEYYTTPAANTDMQHAPQGLAAFIRAYYHCKSADWSGNRPFPLHAATASELAKLPHYYVMQRDKDMAATAEAMAPSAAAAAACAWLTDAELAVYAEEYGRTGFQGGLNAYRRAKDAGDHAAQQLFAGRTIDVPSCFIAGKADWGIYQTPGALQAMTDRLCTRMEPVHLIEGAGHWVQQEKAEEVGAILRRFIAEAGRA